SFAPLPAAFRDLHERTRGMGKWSLSTVGLSSQFGCPINLTPPCPPGLGTMRDRTAAARDALKNHFLPDEPSEELERCELPGRRPGVKSSSPATFLVRSFMAEKMNRDQMLSFHSDYEVRGHARPDALFRYIPALQVTAEAELPPFPSHAGAGDRGKKCHIYKYKPTLAVEPFL